MEDALGELRAYLARVPQGKIEDPGQIESLLAACWGQLASMEGGMTWDKLRNRTEDMDWNPPFLTFVIERHGGASHGSAYAEIQHWTVDIEKRRAVLSPHFGRRLVRKRQARLNVGPIAAELANLILAGKEDPRLKGYGKSGVRVLIGKVLPEISAVKQTLAGRRRRLKTAMQETLAVNGWQRNFGLLRVARPRRGQIWPR